MGETFQRREARTDVDWIAVIRLADGAEVPCSVRDVSATGMKVSIAEGQALPETFALRIVGRDLVFRVRQTWRRRHHLGVLIERIAKLPKAAGAAGPAEAGRAGADGHRRVSSRARGHIGA